MFEGLVTARQAREISIQNDLDANGLFTKVRNAINLAINKGSNEARVEARWEYPIAGMDKEFEWRDYKYSSIEVVSNYLESIGYKVVHRIRHDKDNPTNSFRSLYVKW